MEKRTIGVMLACSSGVKQVSWIKGFIDEIAKMGYNLLELEITDTYKIEEEPYFGYLLGGYTKKELRELDDYAFARGIELVPCIQTLGHMGSVTKTPEYYSIVDIDDILLIDEPRTYELIENMFKTLRDCFRSEKINIGYDEAHKVGRGRYLDKHGCVDRFELLIHHLNKVLEIAKKFGFHVHMWSDMFVRLANNGGYYGKGIKVPQYVIEQMPKDVEIVYWDYGEHEIDEEYFDEMWKTHEGFGRNIWYSSCAWCWYGFAPFNYWTLYAMECAMRQAHKHGVKDHLVTVWCNEGSECSPYSVLPSLYALRQYIDGNFDNETIAENFKKEYGIDFYDFISLDLPNKTSANTDLKSYQNSSKTLLYCDCFLGWRDSQLAKLDEIPFGDYAKELFETGKRMGKYAYLFENMALLCRVLEKKAYLGLRTRKAYREGDREALKLLVDDYKEAAKRVEEFTESFRRAWLQENKPFGWELHQARLGGLQSRLLDCRKRLIEYLNGEAESIPELEEDILPYADGMNGNSYRVLVSLRDI